MQSINIQLTQQLTHDISVFSADTPNGYTIICQAAMGVRASYYNDFAKALAKAGYQVINSDWRGHGQSRVRPGRKVDFGYEALVLDLDQLVNYAKKRFPQNKTLILGHSLGGQIGSLYSARFPDKIDGMIMIASCLVYYAGWPPKLQRQIKIAGRLFPILSQLFGYFPGNRIGFAGREARTVMRDWSHNALKGTYRPIGSSFDYEQALAQLKNPSLVFSIKNDWMAQRQAVENLYKKYHPEAPVQHFHVGKEEIIGNEQPNHFNWAKTPTYFIEQINQWIKTIS